MKDSIRWIIHITCGGILIVLLGLHMGAMHLPDIFKFFYPFPEGSDPVEWSAVISRAKDVTTYALYMIFLPVALYHGLYGLWNVIAEALSSRKLDKIVGWVIVLAGIALYIYGAYTTTVSFINKGM